MMQILVRLGLSNGTIAENSNYSSSVNVSEITYNSVLSGSDALVVELLKNKWGVKNILDSSIVSPEPELPAIFPPIRYKVRWFLL